MRAFVDSLDRVVEGCLDEVAVEVEGARAIQLQMSTNPSRQCCVEQP